MRAATSNARISANLQLMCRRAIRLSVVDRFCIAQALLSAPQAAPVLERAFARGDKLLRANSFTVPQCSDGNTPE